MQMFIYGFLDSNKGLKTFLWYKPILRNFWNSQIFLKYLTVAWQGSGTRSKMPLVHISSHEFLLEKKIWDNLILRSFWISQILLKYFTIAVFSLSQYCYLHYLHYSSSQEQKIRCLLALFIHKNYFKKRKYWTSYFIIKALFVLKILKFLSWLFGHAEKRLD